MDLVSTPGLLVCSILLAALLLFARSVRVFLRLRHIPGPFVAAWTNIPRASWVWGNRAHDVHIALHRKYGKIVRLGPGMVSVQDPAEIRNIYDNAGTFPKSDFYHALLLYTKGKPVPTIFATQDEALHRTLRRPIAGLYSMTKLVSLETYVDTTLQVFLEQLTARYATEPTVCDLGKWLQWFAFDVMGELTFSRRLGFLERAQDVDNITANIWTYFRRTSLVSQMPWLDVLWAKNPVVQRFAPSKPNAIVSFGTDRVRERLALSAEEKAGSERRTPDFLTAFLAAADKDPAIPRFAVTAWMTSNVTAGSDTTAILLRTIFHLLLTRPRAMATLLAEIDAAADEQKWTAAVSWNQARALPYLDAVIKESGRVHPPFGLHFERVVPDAGAMVCGEVLPAGTTVGMSAWVVHHDVDMFGDDCDDWRPERWIEAEKEKRRAMESALFTFGHGKRVCLGKNLAYLEVYKVVPTLLRAFTFKLADPSDKAWKVENRWFVNQTGLNVVLSKRDLGTLPAG